jgi:SNF2 family DNA or RNA helicase
VKRVVIALGASKSDVLIGRESMLIDDSLWSRFSTALIALFNDSRLDGDIITLPLGEFLVKRAHFKALCDRQEVTQSYSPELTEFASRWRLWQDEFLSLLETDVPNPGLSDGDIDGLITAGGWLLDKRTLTAQQHLNVRQVTRISSAANFSVPGSGKTTAALASHFVAKSLGKVDALMVVAPRSAFKEWRETLDTVADADIGRFLPLIDGNRIPDLLLSVPKFSLITYHQLVRVTAEVERFISSRKLHLILDESHRIKAGATGAIARSCLRIAPLAARRDILSGTPMPQSEEDLAPQFDFLYPGMDAGRRITEIIGHPSSLKRFYTRTKYNEVGVSKIEVEYKSHEFTTTQLALYAYLRDSLIRLKTAIQYRLDEANDAQLCTMRLLQSAIDPQLAARSILRSNSEDEALRRIAKEVIDEGDIGQRLKGVIEEARSYRSQGRKTVIWAPFVETIETLCRELADVGAQPIFGKPARSLDDENEYLEREAVLNEFLDKARLDRWVLVVNPAAGSEGISLHTVCQHAIYAGRTYNSAQFLQSRDRINRLGMPIGAKATMSVHTISAPEGIGSIDRHLDERLSAKVSAMANVLDDEDLRQIALDSENFPANESDISLDDILDLIISLGG